MAYRSSSYRNGGSTAAPTFPVPAGAQAGDIAIVCMFTQVSGTITMPLGFAIRYDSGVVHAWRMVIFWKRLTGPDSGTYDFTLPSASYTEGPVGLFSGRLGSGDPWTASSSAVVTDVSAVTVPGITAATGDDLLGHAGSFNGGDWTAPVGMIEREDVNAQCILATADDLAAGATGDKLFDYAGGNSGTKGFIGSLAAAGGGATDLVVADAFHSHTAATATLAQVHALVVADAGHGHAADVVALTAEGALTVADTTHPHTVDVVTLTQAHQLAVDDATHAHAADVLTLAGGSTLTVDDAVHGHAAEPLVLAQVHGLDLASTAHAHAAETLALTQTHSLAAADALHAHTADSLYLVDPTVPLVTPLARTAAVTPESRVATVRTETRAATVPADAREVRR